MITVTTNGISYNFTELTPDNNYTVTVVGRNDVGVGGFSVRIINTATMTEATPSGVANLTNTTYTPNIINVTWDPASSPYCGEVLYYQVVISSDGHCNIVNDTIRAMNLSATFSNLKSNTTYIITVSAVNRATVGLSEMINVATAISSGEQNDDFSTAEAVATSIVGTFLFTVVVTTLINIIIISLYYKHQYEKNMKSSTSESSRFNPIGQDEIKMDTNPSYSFTQISSKNIRMDTNPSYGFTQIGNNTIKMDSDTDPDCNTAQVDSGNIRMDTNPSYSFTQIGNNTIKMDSDTDPDCNTTQVDSGNIRMDTNPAFSTTQIDSNSTKVDITNPTYSTARIDTTNPTYSSAQTVSNTIRMDTNPAYDVAK
ncbi:uncharacterized protein [Dysidea avara]|uniref:uncharacterized protein n=1 Tax=Dysidea avara TaxID=196820 RepID=UPI0033229168